MSLSNEQLKYYRERFIAACERLVASGEKLNGRTFLGAETKPTLLSDDGQFQTFICYDGVACTFIGRKFYAFNFDIKGTDLREFFNETTKDKANRTFLYLIAEDVLNPIHHWGWSEKDGLTIVK